MIFGGYWNYSAISNTIHSFLLSIIWNQISICWECQFLCFEKSSSVKWITYYPLKISKVRLDKDKHMINIREVKNLNIRASNW